MLPNLKGMTIAEARSAWDATTFTGAILPPPPDANALARVTAQQARQGGTPLSPQPAPGVTCLDPDTDPPIDLLLTTGAAWPNPPNPPCQVPHMIDKRRTVAQADWNAAHFTGSFSPANGNFVVKNQSIPGFSWVPCASSITVSHQP